MFWILLIHIPCAFRSSPQSAKLVRRHLVLLWNTRDLQLSRVFWISCSLFKLNKNGRSDMGGFWGSNICLLSERYAIERKWLYCYKLHRLSRSTFQAAFMTRRVVLCCIVLLCCAVLCCAVLCCAVLWKGLLSLATRQIYQWIFGPGCNLGCAMKNYFWAKLKLNLNNWISNALYEILSSKVGYWTQLNTWTLQNTERLGLNI